MIADDIAQRIFEMKRKIFERSCNPNNAKFVVYVGSKTFYEMMNEIEGRVSASALEVMNRGTIMGNKIYQVNDQNHDWKVFQI